MCEGTQCVLHMCMSVCTHVYVCTHGYVCVCVHVAVESVQCMCSVHVHESVYVGPVK